MVEEYRSEDQRIRVLEEITPQIQRSLGEIRETLIAMQQTRFPQEVTVSPPIVPLLLAPVSSPPWAYEYARSLSVLPSMFFQLSDINEIVNKVKEYINNPSAIVFGPTSSGNREDAVKGWKDRCKEEKQTVDLHFPKQSASAEWHIWDHDIDAEITAHLEVTWSFDRCFVYDVVTKLTTQRNDNAKDHWVIHNVTRSIPQADPVEPGRCKPCTPKCLHVLITVYIMMTTTIPNIPGIHRTFNVDLTICPDGLKDNTNYGQSQGKAGVPIGSGGTPRKPPIPPHHTDPDEGWGVSRVDKDQAAPDKKYFPREPSQVK